MTGNSMEQGSNGSDCQAPPSGSRVTAKPIGRVIHSPDEIVFDAFIYAGEVNCRKQYQKRIPEPLQATLQCACGVLLLRGADADSYLFRPTCHWRGAHNNSDNVNVIRSCAIQGSMLEPCFLGDMEIAQASGLWLLKWVSCMIYCK